MRSFNFSTWDWMVCCCFYIFIPSYCVNDLNKLRSNFLPRSVVIILGIPNREIQVDIITRSTVFCSYIWNWYCLASGKIGLSLLRSTCTIVMVVMGLQYLNLCVSRFLIFYKVCTILPNVDNLCLLMAKHIIVNHVYRTFDTWMCEVM